MLVLNSDEQRRKRFITAELQGEAAKYGGYFITHDERILTRAGRLSEVLPPSLIVVTLLDFLAILDDWAVPYPR